MTPTVTTVVTMFVTCAVAAKAAKAGRSSHWKWVGFPPLKGSIYEQGYPPIGWEALVFLRSLKCMISAALAGSQTRGLHNVAKEKHHGT